MDSACTSGPLPATSPFRREPPRERAPATAPARTPSRPVARARAGRTRGAQRRRSGSRSARPRSALAPFRGGRAPFAPSDAGGGQLSDTVHLLGVLLLL